MQKVQIELGFAIKKKEKKWNVKKTNMLLSNWIKCQTLIQICTKCEIWRYGRDIEDIYEGINAGISDIILPLFLIYTRNIIYIHALEHFVII